MIVFPRKVVVAAPRLAARGGNKDREPRRAPQPSPRPQPLAMATFHPNKSQVSEARLADFIHAPITGDLSEIPGVGAATVKVLNQNEIFTSYQLIGKYLSFKDKDVGPVEHADRFYFWLQSIGTPGGHRAGTVHSIAEKMNVTFVGIYDSSAYEEVDDA